MLRQFKLLATNSQKFCGIIKNGSSGFRAHRLIDLLPGIRDIAVAYSDDREIDLQCGVVRLSFQSLYGDILGFGPSSGFKIRPYQIHCHVGISGRDFQLLSKATNSAVPMAQVFLREGHQAKSVPILGIEIDLAQESFNGILRPVEVIERPAQVIPARGVIRFSFHCPLIKLPRHVVLSQIERL